MSSPLFSPDPPEAGDSSQDTPPPAASIVATGQRTEREVELEKELEAARATVKAREVRVSELEDENHRLKSATTPPPRRKPLLEGATFFS